MAPTFPCVYLGIMRELEALLRLPGGLPEGVRARRVKEQMLTLEPQLRKRLRSRRVKGKRRLLLHLRLAQRWEHNRDGGNLGVGRGVGDIQAAEGNELINATTYLSAIIPRMAT